MVTCKSPMRISKTKGNVSTNFHRWILGRFKKASKKFHCEQLLIDISLTVKAATLIFISGRGSAISSTKEGTSGFIYNLFKS